jgi:hypothetical protein
MAGFFFVISNDFHGVIVASFTPAGANLSDYPRWSYCLQSNIAFKETSISWKVPVDVVANKPALSLQAESLSNADFKKKRK